MKVIHCLNHFLPDHIAGTEMYVYNLISHLQDLGVEGAAVIPNYGKTITEEYTTGKIRVIRYAEPSVTDRALIMGKRDPDGLPFFLDLLKNEKPDIVHFHELAGSNGITYRHVEVSKSAGFKNVMTFHLAGYSCKTGNLMYRDEKLCDGVIRIARCADCYYKVKQNSAVTSMITYPASLMLYAAGIDSTKWNSRIGTGLGFPFIIKKLRSDLLQLAEHCEALISLTAWYKNILIRNDISADKIIHIPQGLTAQINNGIQKETRSDGPLKLIFAGRISRFKGLDLLISALQDIDQTKISLDIYGPEAEDDYAAELKRVTARMTNIQWKGRLEPGTVADTISRYDVFCLPSAFSEMSPLVIREAFSVKVPVLASDVYGNAEQVENNKNGWLFKFKDTADLNVKLQMLAGDRNLIQKTKQHIGNVRSFSEVAGDQLRVYQKILNIS